jgi:hypothetical protein
MTTEPKFGSQPEPKPQNKKATIMAAFEEDVQSGGDVVDFLSPTTGQPKNSTSKDWAFGDGAKSKEKPKTESWDPFSESDKSKSQAKSTTATTTDDPWSTDLADLSLGSKTGKPAQQQGSGKTMAAMRGAPPPKTIEFTSNPWEDSPFGATTMTQTKTSPTYPQTGGFPPTTGGFPPTYPQYPPQGYYQPPPQGYGGYPPQGYGGGYPPPTAQPSPFGAFAPPPKTSGSYDPFASITVGQQPAPIPSSATQKKQTTAFDGLGW